MFHLVEDHLTHCDIGAYTSYGIAAGPVVIHDISASRPFVEALIRQFEAEALAPEHLQAAVEDAILSASILSGAQRSEF
ncbi:MAG: hypothetical protein HFE64_07760 [Lachnospiraceae bacterium]|jgi:hypothetical protein|nr:hypothetical protein [Lachnospiraceae bacterium]